MEVLLLFFLPTLACWGMILYIFRLADHRMKAVKSFDPIWKVPTWALIGAGAFSVCPVLNLFVAMQLGYFLTAARDEWFD